MTNQEEQGMFEFAEENNVQGAKIKVIGVGGGGVCGDQSGD